MGSDIFLCGGAGAGTRTKLVNNFLAISYCQMNAEALSLMETFGLNLEKTLEVLYGTTATNGQLKVAWRQRFCQGIHRLVLPSIWRIKISALLFKPLMIKVVYANGRCSQKPSALPDAEVSA